VKLRTAGFTSTSANHSRQLERPFRTKIDTHRFRRSVIRNPKSTCIGRLSRNTTSLVGLNPTPLNLQTRRSKIKTMRATMDGRLCLDLSGVSYRLVMPNENPWPAKVALVPNIDSKAHRKTPNHGGSSAYHENYFRAKTLPEKGLQVGVFAKTVYKAMRSPTLQRQSYPAWQNTFTSSQHRTK